MLRAFSAKEGDSNAFLIQESGGIYRQVMEMQIKPDGVQMNPIGTLKLNQKNSAIVAFYLDKDAGYGFFMHENGVF